ncbi:MAG: tyrosinase family protein [Phycisphaerae bacterium]|nr:tyrosinase family protein [Phycisphaerae bacterium]
MKLPQTLYDAVRAHMGDHGDWHQARYRERWLPVDERAEWRAARARFPTLKFLDEPGAGEQFLTFHREMIRNFKWLIANTPGHGYTLEAWTRVPSDLESWFRPMTLARSYARILELIVHGTADQLGSFIERTELDTSEGSNLHNLLHGLIDAKEARDHPGHPSLIEAGMADLSVAHYNEHFWSLHAWIDDLYAMWQRAHGQIPDQSALEPDHSHGGGPGGGPGGGHGPSLPPVPAPAPPPPAGPPDHHPPHHHPPHHHPPGTPEPPGGGDPTVHTPAHHHIRPKL